MKLWKLYTGSTPSAILFQGVVGIVAGLLLAAIYSVVEHENGLRRFAFAIFGIPVSLTICKLLLSLGIRSKENDERNEG